VAILPSDRLAKWQLPQGKPVVSTVEIAIERTKKQFKAIIDTEVSTSTAKVNKAVERVSAALATDAAQTKAFLEKVIAVRVKPFASPTEEQLALTVASHGLTVAEVLGVLSAEADRPVVAARLSAGVPVFTNPGAFAARVELSRRAPASFTTHADAGFKLTAIHNRARVRDAVASILNTHAAKVAAGKQPEPLDRAALEAAVAKRLGLDANAILPAEYVQAVFDTCRDWAEDFGQLNHTERELRELLASIESGHFDLDEDTKEALTFAKKRRDAIQQDIKRRQSGVANGCRILGEYGPSALTARDWLREQKDKTAGPTRRMTNPLTRRNDSRRESAATSPQRGEVNTIADTERSTRCSRQYLSPLGRGRRRRAAAQTAGEGSSVFSPYSVTPRCHGLRSSGGRTPVMSRAVRFRVT
jgi:hypothetical protein